MTPRVSSILGFPEEKWNAWVREESDEEEAESPDIIAGGDRNTSSFEGPAGPALELVDMDMFGAGAMEGKQFRVSNRQQ